MATITQSTRIARTARPQRTGLVGWLLRLDAAWREQRTFRALDEDRLSDMGLTKADRDGAFYRQFLDRGLD